MIKSIAHICIGAKDLAKSENFYVSSLDLKKKFDFLRGGKKVGFYVVAGNGTYIEVFQVNEATVKDDDAVKHFCLEVDNIDRTSAALKSKGVAVTDKLLGHDQSWQAWLADPDGVKIELHEYTANSSQRTGKDCVLD
jgi:glyoxylase I family protein